MNAKPAEKYMLTGRGFIRQAAYADLVIIDPETVIDRATYEEPRVGSPGIRHVIVNGQFVVRDGRHTHARPGRALRRGER